jgi:hypothetical protein
MTDTETLLNTACEQALSASLVPLSQESHISGKFSSLEDGSIRFIVPDGEAFHVLGMVSVTFQSAGGIHSFLSSVVDNDPTTLWLSMPRQLISTDGRKSARMPVTAPVEVDILGAHYAAKAKLVDIALTGMKVEFSADPKLIVGERFPVVLCWEEQRVELVAELRHKHGNSCGFFFPQSIRRGVVDAPKDLTRLIKSLEKWSQSR